VSGLPWITTVAGETQAQRAGPLLDHRLAKRSNTSACRSENAPQRVRSLSIGWPSGLLGTIVRRGGRARLRSKHGVRDDHAGAKLGLDLGVALAPALVHLPGHRFWEDVVLSGLDAGECRARDFARTRLRTIDAPCHVRVNRAWVCSVDADAPFG